MKHPIGSRFGLAVSVSVALVSSASAVVSIDYVSIGYAGNAADTADGDAYTSGFQRYGAVAYEYKIAKNETTIGQYAEFLNAKAKSDPYALYDTNMMASTINGISRSGSSGSYIYTVNPGSANKPITYVSWFDAARFCNWLHNGQGSGSTEMGAYTLNGAVSGMTPSGLARRAGCVGAPGATPTAAAPLPPRAAASTIRRSRTTPSASVLPASLNRVAWS